MFLGDTYPDHYVYPSAERAVARRKPTVKKRPKPKAETRSNERAAPTLGDVVAWKIAGMPTDYGQA